MPKIVYHYDIRETFGNGLVCARKRCERPGEFEAVVSLPHYDRIHRPKKKVEWFYLCQKHTVQLMKWQERSRLRRVAAYKAKIGISPEEPK
jgi:hypothetical protein